MLKYSERMNKVDYQKLFHEIKDFERDTFAERMDEQVKQFYDILMLTQNCISEIDCAIVRRKYKKLAHAEWETRKEEEYDLELVIADVRKQLLRYEMADSGVFASIRSLWCGIGKINVRADAIR